MNKVNQKRDVSYYIQHWIHVYVARVKGEGVGESQLVNLGLAPLFYTTRCSRVKTFATRSTAQVRKGGGRRERDDPHLSEGDEVHLIDQEGGG